VAIQERIVERIIERPRRQRLPETRRSITHRFNVAGHEGYLTVGLYEDGGPGELFITMSKEGSTIGGLMDSLGTAISVALQYGVPIESLVTKFEHQRFEPMGMTTSRDIPFAKSLVDYIFRWLGMQFIHGYRDTNAPRRSPEAGQPGHDQRGSSKEVSTWSGSEEPGGTPETSGRQSNGAGGPPGAGPAKTAVREPETRGGRMPRLSTGLAAAESPGAGSAAKTAESSDTAVIANALEHSNAHLQSDAPACDVCGLIMVRNGTCYKCMNCGNSLGCS
jgi:ribonucleoside-diphosphate reductase alpha chain